MATHAALLDKSVLVYLDCVVRAVRMFVSSGFLLAPAGNPFWFRRKTIISTTPSVRSFLPLRVNVRGKEAESSGRKPCPGMLFRRANQA